MQLWIIALFALQLVGASWVVPRDLEDGVYHILVPHPQENTTEKRAFIKRQDKTIDFPFEKLINDPDVNQPSKWGDNKVSFRNLPLLKEPGDNGRKGRIPFKAYDCVYNEPEMLESDYDTARANLFAYCTRWRIPPRTVHMAVAKKGNVIAYACSWSMWNNVCSPREFKWVESNLLDPNCGRLTPAWTASKVWQKTYGRGWIGSRICNTDIYGRYIPRVTKNIWFGLPPDMDNEDQAPTRYMDGAEWENKVAKESG